MNRFWAVRISMTTPWKSGGSYERNETIGVSAPTIEKAISRVYTEFPDAKIWAVNHQGEIKLESQ